MTDRVLLHEMEEKNPGYILYFGLLLFFLLEYIRPDKSIPVLRMLKVGTILPFVLFTATLLFSKKISSLDVYRSRNFKWLMFFLALILMSVLTADVTLYAFDKLKSVVGYVIVFFILAKETNTIGRIKGVFATLSLIHVIIIALSPEIILSPETRSYLAYGVYLGDGNDFALSVSIALPLCFYLYLDEKPGIRKMLYLGACILLVISIIGTSSRGGSLALFAIVLYLWSKSRRKIWGVVVILIVAGIVAMYAPARYFSRLDSITDYQNEGSARARITAWKSAVNMAVAHPLLGVGAGHFPVAFGREFMSAEHAAASGRWITAHSCYFLILGELGLPGMIFLLSIIVSNLWSFDKRARALAHSDAPLDIQVRRLLICLNGGLIGFAVAGAFLSATYYPHLYTIAGLFTSAQLLYDRNYSVIALRE